MFRTTETRRAILVVLDGLRPDAIDAFDLSNIRRLMQVCASTMTARTVSPSLTWPAITSMLTGVTPETHGILADSAQIPRPRAKLWPLPTLLKKAGYPTSAFVSEIPPLYRPIAGHLARSVGFEETSFRGKSALEVLFAARNALWRQRRGLIFLHWADADAAGHRYGWMSREYGEAARRLDEALGSLVLTFELMRDRGTLLVALADHGGGGIVDNHHDGSHPLNTTIPMMLAGGSVHRATLEDAQLIDVPTTIAWALGVTPPSAYRGRVLSEAFFQTNNAVAMAMA